MHEVHREIRQRICSGAWPPGTQLPTREALAELFDASPSTIQLAISGLVEDGSVVTSKRGGAHVAEAPPESCRFILALGDNALRSAGQPTYFIDTMAAATARIAELRPGFRMECAQAADPLLAETVRGGGLAKILYFGSPLQAPAVANAGILLATFIVPDQPLWATVNIRIDNHESLQGSLRSHLARGRKRIAILDNGGLMTTQTQSRPLGQQFQHIADAVAKSVASASRPGSITSIRGIPLSPIRPRACCSIDPSPLAQRPNALVLLDDHLLPPVLAAIKILRLRIPLDLSVSVQAHYLPVGPPDNCIRFGFDVGTFIADIVDQLAKVHRGIAVPTLYRMRIDELGGPPVPNLLPRSRRLRPGAGRAADTTGLLHRVQTRDGPAAERGARRWHVHTLRFTRGGGDGPWSPPGRQRRSAPAIAGGRVG